MKKIIGSLFLLFTGFTVIAEEGMLIPSLISAFEDDMKAMGMRLSADDIYSVNKSSMKDAIMHFGGGCTAEVVSGKGLLLTNHHCGYSQVQSHSSLEHDYTKYGFWAKSLAEELPNSGLTASRIVRIEDVTATMFSGTAGLTGEEYQKRVKANMEVLINDAKAGNHYEASIKAFNYGNEYYMVVQEVFKDVRLVGAPPSCVGKFGGDTDNWVWPRHTGDFSVFRIYVGADNKPADYSTSNVPYTPLHYFPISMRNRIPGEFTMVYGFPGTTEQHLSSGHLKYIMDKERPARILMREQALGVIDAGMKSSDLVRIQYASKQASLANGWKKWIGQLGGLRDVNALQIKYDREKAYNEKTATREDWNAKYGSVIQRMNELIERDQNADFAYVMNVEYLYIGPEVFKRARALNDLLEVYEDMVELGELDNEVEKLVNGAPGFYKNYDKNVDKNVFIKLTNTYKELLGSDVYSSYSELLKNYTGEQLAADIFENSVLVSEDKFLQAVNNLDSATVAALRKDKAIMLWAELVANFGNNVLPKARGLNQEMDNLLQVYVAGMMEMFPKDKHWPDANSTLRITYGKLEGSAPHDGARYTEHTTLDGIMAKYATGNADFELLDDFKSLVESKDYGRYAQDGEMWVCFTGSNHTTGGNSGSPVIDADGNLMGLNFDRSWESTMSDYMFDPNRCRNIVVDIRYVLWIMDKYAGATHLVDEMNLVTGKHPMEKKYNRWKKKCKC